MFYRKCHADGWQASLDAVLLSSPLHSVADVTQLLIAVTSLLTEQIIESFMNKQYACFASNDVVVMCSIFGKCLIEIALNAFPHTLFTSKASYRND